MVVLGWDLGLQRLVLLACLAFPAIVLLIVRSKWRKSVARSEEIKRLLILASEETSRAELEASSGLGYGYGYGHGHGHGGAFTQQPRDYRCAVCYCPTTTRCSQCKAVRYCSGKCQIIHWRQGHREECHPPEDVTEFGWKAIDNEKDDYDGDSSVNDVRHPSDSTLNNKNALGFAESGCSIGKLSPNDDNAELKFKTENSSVQSSVASFSGFSSSAENTLSDDASGSDSICSNESPGSDEHLSDDNAGDLHGDCSADQKDETRFSSTMSANLINSVDSFSGSFNESNETVHHFDDDVKKGSVVELPPRVSTYQRSNLDSNGKEDHLHSPSTAFSGVRNGSASESHLQFSSSVAESDGSSLRVEHLENEHVGIHDALARDSVIDELSPSRRESTSKYEKSGCLGDEDIKPSSLPKSREAGSIIFSAQEDALNVDSLKWHSAGQPIPSVKADSTVEDKTNVTFSPNLSSRSPNGRDISKASGDNGTDKPVASILSKPESSRQGIDSLGKYDEKGIFSYEYFFKLYTWKEVGLLPCGFINCGNSCYANAVLQCLAFTPPLTAYFLQGLHSKICAKKDWCFMCEFERLILKAKEGISPISPIGIVSHLRNIGSQLNHGRQEDAHEFLRYVVDAMQSTCLVKSGEESASWEEETTLIGQTFGGYLRSKIKCMKCLNKSERHERMMDLTVEIEGDIGTLEDALLRFTETEPLDGENKYQCSSCKSYEKARKKLTILEAPNVLTIALKRFQSGKYGKLNKSITFPEILNLAPYMSGTSDKLPIYRLYGVIVHLDAMNATFSGHYICYVKNPRNRWFKIDDSTVTPVELDSVMRMGAYMLLYARCSPRAPRCIRNAMISADLRHRAGPTKVNTRISISSIKPIVRLPSDFDRISTSSYGSAGIEAFYYEFHRLKRLLEEDSSSDNSSLFGSTSDESSCSTDSTRDSASADDLSDYIFGDTVRGMSSPWRPTDSDTSSASSSPSNPSRPPVLPRPGAEKGGVSASTDPAKLRSNSNSSSGSVFRETQLERHAPVHSLHNVKSRVSFRDIGVGENRSKEM